MQYVAVYCSAVRCGAVQCSVALCSHGGVRVLQCVEVRCSALAMLSQSTAMLRAALTLAMLRAALTLDTMQLHSKIPAPPHTRMPSQKKKSCIQIALC